MKTLHVAASILVPFAVQAILTVTIESLRGSIVPNDPGVFTFALFGVGPYFFSAAMGFALLARAVKQPLVWGILYFPVMLVAVGLFAGFVTVMLHGI